MTSLLLYNCPECGKINLVAQGLLELFNADLGTHASRYEALDLTDFLV